MKLVLNNFRYYEGIHEFDLNVGVTLLSGTSGTGKTTILESIDYCLYGKLQKQYSHGKKSCYVRLILSDKVWIQRNSGPGKLDFETGKGLYSGAEAQHLINQMYGSREVFLSTSYIKQGESCALLAGTNAEKMNLIRSISFRDDNVQESQEKIKSKLKLQNETLKKLESEYQIAKVRFEDFLSGKPEIGSGDENIDDLENAKKILQNDLEANNKLFVEVLRLETKIKTLEGLNLSETNFNEDEFQQKLAEIDTKISEQSAKLGLIRENASKIALQKQTQDVLKKQKDVVSKYETEVISTQMKTGKLSVSEVDELVKKIENGKTLQKSINDILKKHGISRITEIPIKVGEYASGIRNAKTKLLQAETDLENQKWNLQNKDILNCPKCSAGLSFKEGKLIQVSDNHVPEQKPVSDPNVSQKKIETLKTEINNLEWKKMEISKDETKLKELEETLSSLNIPSSKPDISELNKLKNAKNNLKSAIEQLQNLEKTTKTEIEIRTDLGNEKQVDQEIAKLLSEKNNLQHEKKKHEENHVQIQNLKALKDEIGDKKSETIKEKSNEIESEIKKIDGKITASKNKKKHDELESSKKSLEEKLQTCSSKAATISKLYEISKQVELDVLEESVFILNCHMKDYLNIMFPDDEISIEFKTIRQSKSKPDAKSMQCSMNIFYKNASYDSYKQLSGGERDRVAIAMTLALNSLLDSNMILLDESLRSLDQGLKISIVEMLKNIVDDNKVCVVIEHVGVEGVYDKQISL